MGALPADRLAKFESRQRLFSLFGLFIILGISVVLNSINMMAIAEHTTKLISRMIQIGDLREVGVMMSEASSESFKKIKFDSPVPGRSFVVPPRFAVLNDDSVWDNLSTEKMQITLPNSLSSAGPDQITFVYSRFRWIPHAIIIWLILNLISIPQTRYVKRRLKEQYEKELKAETALAKEKIAREVRHNLRTPLAVLSKISELLPRSLNQEIELLNSTNQQIRSLISKLDLDQSNLTEDKQPTSSIFSTIRQAMLEVRQSLPVGIHFEESISDEISSAITRHIPSDIRAAFANLANNAVDAMNGVGELRIHARDLGVEIEISIQDSGSGVPNEIAHRIFDEGFTFGKKNGTGFGLFHAKSTFEGLGGSIHMFRTSELGTEFRVTLPIADRASWYVPRIRLNPSSKLVILDDKDIAHDLWRLRLNELQIKNEIYHFKTPEELRQFSAGLSLSEKHQSHWVLFFDYDLGREFSDSSENGLQLLESSDFGSEKFLVTGSFDDVAIQTECSRLSFGLIPKSQVETLPILVLQTRNEHRSSSQSREAGKNLGEPQVSVLDS